VGLKTDHAHFFEAGDKAVKTPFLLMRQYVWIV